ncbi:recombinase family protein [Chitinophaga sp. OAE865]|uniref:recombinase family protein n=1 Tax=Chitinophaga sp. OAE865 TaxID=2817898 RepID=UPI00339874E4
MRYHFFCIIVVYQKTTAMNNINYFAKYIPQNDAPIKSNHEVWSYTRVSSKEQFEKNSSVERQQEASRYYADQLGYTITEEFGGTYESAKSDFTPKEFSRLIERVTTSRKKPYAILVYKMSRFSRSGGNAIGLVNTLVEDLGVHLIEVCSGISTTTERGKAAIYESLFHAFKENLERKEIIIPAMKAHLKSGKRFGASPVGYDHYGPRVRDERFISKHQRIEINKDGELLKEAWKWKLSGLYSDAQILHRLEARGLKLLSQKISAIWRNPFYCGTLINKLAGEPIKGNWPPIVSQEDFVTVQEMLEKNPSRYHHNKDEENRPLNRLLKCDECKGYLVGYVNRKKNLHYYRCLKCRGVSLNAATTKFVLRRGANDLFTDLLDNFQITEDIVPVIQLQLLKLFSGYNDSEIKEDANLKSQFVTLERKLKELKIRYGMGEIDKETYELTHEHLMGQIADVNKELNRVTPKISNLEILIPVAVAKVNKLGSAWRSNSLEEKRRIQKILFPEGIYYNVNKHQYRTSNINQFLVLIHALSVSYSANKKRDLQFNIENPYSVARSGVEPETFGL